VLCIILVNMNQAFLIPFLYHAAGRAKNDIALPITLFDATAASYLSDERRYAMRYATSVTSAWRMPVRHLRRTDIDET